MAIAGELPQLGAVLGWSGRLVGPVWFGGVEFRAVSALNEAEHTRRLRVGQGAVTGRREMLDRADRFDPAVGRLVRPAVELVGALLDGRAAGDAARVVQGASLLAGYCPRAVLLNDTPDLMAALIDAAVLDVGIVVQRGGQVRVMSRPGPRTGPPELTAREWDLRETVYAAWLRCHPDGLERTDSPVSTNR